jgi:hypothetical protein
MVDQDNPGAEYSAKVVRIAVAFLQRAGIITTGRNNF